MDFDKSEFERIKSLDDNEFKDKLTSALDAAGATNEVKAQMAQNIPQIKKALESLSANDLMILAQKADKLTLDAIKKMLD